MSPMRLFQIVVYTKLDVYVFSSYLLYNVNYFYQYSLYSVAFKVHVIFSMLLTS